MENRSHFIKNQEALLAAVQTIIEIFSKETGEEITGIKSIQFQLNKQKTQTLRQSPDNENDPQVNANEDVFPVLEDLPCFPTPHGWVCPKR